jgi:hypothetical protein
MAGLDAEDTTTKIKLDKNTLNIQSDPLHHGFWTLSLDRGALPERYRGKYTSRVLAMADAKAYISERPSTPKD